MLSERAPGFALPPQSLAGGLLKCPPPLAANREGPCLCLCWWKFQRICEPMASLG